MGSEIVALDRSGPIGFDTETHLRNFARYLFSRTRRHPRTPATALNFAVELDPRVPRTVRRAFHNEDPEANLSRFLGEMDYAFTPSQQWCNDIACAAFLVPAGEAWVSNFVSGTLGESGEGLDVHDGAAFCLCRDAGFDGSRDALVAALTDRIAPGSRVFQHRQAPQEIRSVADQAVLRRFNRCFPGGLVFAMSHLDQDGPYHVHRILWRADGGARDPAQIDDG